MSDTEGPTFGARSIYGARTKRGLVEITLGSLQALVEPAKAREMAAMLVECASAAEGDEVLMEVLTGSGTSHQRALTFLLAIRQRRDVIERAARAEARRAIAQDRELLDLPES